MADAEYPPRQKVGASQLPAWLSFTLKPPGVYILPITPPPRGGGSRVTKQGSNKSRKEKIIIKKDKKGKIIREIGKMKN